MYKIMYTKTAVKQIPNLKAATLDDMVKNLINVLETNPSRTDRPLKNWLGI